MALPLGFFSKKKESRSGNRIWVTWVTSTVLLSSEIDQFELRNVNFDDFLLFSNEIHTVGTKGNVMISTKILENRPPRIEIDLSRSSRGVQKCSWALQIVIRVC